MAVTAVSGKPCRVKSRLLAATSADAPPSASITLISEAPPIEGAFNITNQSRCFVAAPFIYACFVKPFHLGVLVRHVHEPDVSHS